MQPVCSSKHESQLNSKCCLWSDHVALSSLAPCFSSDSVSLAKHKLRKSRGYHNDCMPYILPWCIASDVAIDYCQFVFDRWDWSKKKTKTPTHLLRQRYFFGGSGKRNDRQLGLPAMYLCVGSAHLLRYIYGISANRKTDCFILIGLSWGDWLTVRTERRQQQCGYWMSVVLAPDIRQTNC